MCPKKLDGVGVRLDAEAHRRAHLPISAQPTAMSPTREP